jgi:hypothetical protein
LPFAMSTPAEIIRSWWLATSVERRSLAATEDLLQISTSEI